MNPGDVEEPNGVTDEVAARLISVMIADEVEGIDAPHVVVYEHLATGTVWYRGPFSTGLAAATAVEEVHKSSIWSVSLARLFPPLDESVISTAVAGTEEHDE